MKFRIPPPRRPSERGGVTILTVLTLLVLMTVVAFSMGRNSMRELALSGTAWQASKASEAAEAGLDWFVLWTNKSNWASATSHTRNTFVQELQVLSQPGWENRTHFLDESTKTWDRASRMASSETDTDTDLVFANTGTDYQQATTGNVTLQSFDLTFRYLGASLVKTTSSTGGAGKDLILFQAISQGKASVPVGGSYVRFNTTREMFASVLP